MRKVPAIAMLLALPVLANDLTIRNSLSASHTDRFTVPAAGTIRFDNSFGEVDVDGWDRNEVEVTVVRTSEHLFAPKDRAEAQRRLDSVLVRTKQEGNDVVISTIYPPLNGIGHIFSRRADVEIAYRVKAPRSTKIVVNHNNGGVNISDITGDIHAVVGNGQITLTLAASIHYGIDARCGVGDVYSDLEGGEEHRRHMFGKAFMRPAGAGAPNLFLRVHSGDIMIVKLSGPPTD